MLTCPLRYQNDRKEEKNMSRMYPYLITLVCYSGRRYRYHIHASNHLDAFDKAHRFANPIAMSGRDGVQFIDCTKLTKQYCIENNVSFDD